MAKGQTTNEKVAFIAEKVLDGKQATPEEARSPAASVLGLDGEKDETSSLAAKVAGGNYEPTQEEMKSLAASALGRE